MDQQFIFILIMAGIIGLAIVSYFFQRQTQLQAWNDLAVRTGLTFEGGLAPWSPVRLSGLYDGYETKVDTFTRRAGKNSTTYTRIVLSLKNPSPLSLILSEQGIFDQAGKLLGAKEILIGDEAIDRRYKIKGQPEAEVTRVLAGGDLRQKLLELPSFSRIEIGPEQVWVHKVGLTRKTEDLRKLLELLKGLADEAGRSSKDSIWNES